MKYLYFLLLFHFLISCKNQPEKVMDDSQKFIDSFDRARKVDSMVNQSLANVYWDTVGISNAPVKIISARLTKKEYSTFKDVYLSYKNISNKKIEAIRFRWYGETAFGEPADLGNLTQEGFGGGFDDSGLAPGKMSNGEWSVLSRNAKKIVKAWPTEVIFQDGTKWKSTSKY
jgi:hypothetical protein